MSKRNGVYLSGMAVALAAVLTAGCGSNSGGPRTGPPTPGQVFIFGTDAPVCDVESFVATITSASLTPQSGGTAVPLIVAASPATVDFARLTDFTSILSSASVAPGTYSQLQFTITNPQLIALNTSTNPPSPLVVPVTLTTASFTIAINPPLTVTTNTTSGLLFDFNLGKSIQVDLAGQVTGTVNPQITVAATTNSGTTVGEADSVFGTIQSVSTANLPTGFTGSFALALHDGTGQTLTVLSNSSTVFEGDGVTTLADLTANTFVEVDASVNTSGQIVAQTVDAEEQTSAASQNAAFLGKVINIVRDSSGNATSFTLLVDDESPNLGTTIPLHSGLSATLSSSTKYFTNWQHLNQQAFTFGPTTLGLAEKVAVFGVLGSGTSPALAAHQVFLRPRNVLGNSRILQMAGSDGKTGAFTFTPCGALFGGANITVLTYANTNFIGIAGLQNLTTPPTVNLTGLLFYAQTSGASHTGGVWIAPTWVMQTRVLHQLPN